jgi:hypothetical protein
VFVSIQLNRELDDVDILLLCIVYVVCHGSADLLESLDGSMDWKTERLKNEQFPPSVPPNPLWA